MVIPSSPFVQQKKKKNHLLCFIISVITAKAPFLHPFGRIGFLWSGGILQWLLRLLYLQSTYVLANIYIYIYIYIYNPFWFRGEILLVLFFWIVVSNIPRLLSNNACKTTFKYSNTTFQQDLDKIWTSLLLRMF